MKIIDDFNKVNNGFQKGFNAVYYAKVRCPLCKEKIHANTLTCPYCKTNFKEAPYNKRTKWQSIAMKIAFLISTVIGVLICLNNAPILLGIVVGLALFGCSYVLIQKIQSVLNYFHR